MLFLKEYKPTKIKKDNIYKSRIKVFRSKNTNLKFLIKKRFLWMEKYLINKKEIIELGSGNGCIKSVIVKKKIILSDIVKYPWINKKIDMKKMSLGKKNYNKIVGHSKLGLYTSTSNMSRISTVNLEDALLLCHNEYS